MLDMPDTAVSRKHHFASRRVVPQNSAIGRDRTLAAASHRRGRARPADSAAPTAANRPFGAPGFRHCSITGYPAPTALVNVGKYRINHDIMKHERKQWFAWFPQSRTRVI